MTHPAGAQERPNVGTLFGSMADWSGWLWICTAAVTSVVAYGLAASRVIPEMLASGGVTETQRQELAFAAGFTLPLVVSVAGLTLAYAHNQMPREIPQQLVTIGLALAASGFVSHFLGLGLAPDMPTRPIISAPLWISLPATAAFAYVSVYGVPLAACGTLIGFSSAAQIMKWQGFSNKA